MLPHRGRVGTETFSLSSKGTVIRMKPDIMYPLIQRHADSREIAFYPGLCDSAHGSYTQGFYFTTRFRGPKLK